MTQDLADCAGSLRAARDAVASVSAVCPAPDQVDVGTLDRAVPEGLRGTVCKVLKTPLAQE